MPDRNPQMDDHAYQKIILSFSVINYIKLLRQHSLKNTHIEKL